MTTGQSPEIQRNTPGDAQPISRRDFVGSTAGAAIGGALAGSLVGPALGAMPLGGRVHAGGSDTIRVGLIGCGGRGTGAAMQAIAADPGAVLHALADIFPERLNACLANLQQHAQGRDGEEGGSAWRDKISVAQDRRFIGFDAAQRLIASGVDVVLLATPPAFRPEHLKAAIDANKHVFCEKPMAVDATGVRSVIASAAQAQRKKLSLVAGFCWRYHPPERALMDRLADGAIGQIHTAYSTYNTSGFPTPHARQPGWSDTEFMLRNWHYFTALSGDHIAEQACHAIDWINWAFPQGPAACVAVGGRQVRPDLAEAGNIYDHFAVTYEYEDGRRAFHMCRHFPNSANDNSAHFAGTRGHAQLLPWTPVHTIEGDNPWSYSGPRPNMYQVEHDELFASIRAGEPINDGDWMAQSTMMAIMGRMAAYTGQRVTWDQAMSSSEHLLPPEWAWGPWSPRGVALPGKTKLV